MFSPDPPYLHLLHNLELRSKLYKNITGISNTGFAIPAQSAEIDIIFFDFIPVRICNPVAQIRGEAIAYVKNPLAIIADKVAMPAADVVVMRGAVKGAYVNNITRFRHLAQVPVNRSLANRGMFNHDMIVNLLGGRVYIKLLYRFQNQAVLDCASFSGRNNNAPNYCFSRNSTNSSKPFLPKTISESSIIRAGMLKILYLSLSSG